MIQATENNNYLMYANTLFSFFSGLNEGEGGFLMRTMRAKFSGYEQREFLDYLYKVLYNLCTNGFLTPKDVDGNNVLEGWINLTAKGYDHLMGGPLEVNKVDLNRYIILSDTDNKQFDDLWSLIGEQTKAPFYLKGPTYLNMIRPYLTEYVSDYTTYIEERRQKELSTSRRVWYRELYLKVPQTRKVDFFADLSYAVSLSYYFKEDEDGGLFDERIDIVDEEIKKLLPECQSLVSI